ncbi:LytR/AlgR family response regulator transcription factor [Pedobacter duraquae]|uniref:LytTR family two component transcriptional regulator n=1 Tax=Pedobacter duraquae TaxID=425511 RepID=A0A4R6IFL3_9SPHI|nr:LytTR family DNA-binding domain-containing protein [Pedobacter duraquae]TDO20882.1 LytTR family two component transcriptional regulator [Pedobacter duraquae]
MCALLSHTKISTVLVDDEPVAVERLRNELQVFPQINVIGIASDGISAVKLINAERPDVVFLDIQMPEINGFGVMSRLIYQPLIVFVTAFDEYAVTAFEKNSLDYLLKPVASDRLAITMQRVLNRKNEQAEVFAKIKEIEQEKEAKAYITTIPVKTGPKIQLISVSDIYFFEAKDKYVFLHTYDDEKLLDNSLTYLESRLPPEFIRVHRSFILNKHKVKEIQKYFKGGFVFTLSDTSNSRIKSASSFNEDIKNKLLLI